MHLNGKEQDCPAAIRNFNKNESTHYQRTEFEFVG